MSSAREAEGLPAGGGAPATITPEFAVLGAEVVEDAAAPTLRFRLGVSEPSQREIFTIALTAQINVELLLLGAITMRPRASASSTSSASPSAGRRR